MQVAKLFYKHTDLLHKFSIFLPEQESMGVEGMDEDGVGGGGAKRYALYVYMPECVPYMYTCLICVPYM